MAISDKLNYLIETKQLFKDRLNSLGAEIIESTTFRNYLNWLDNMYNKVSDKTDLAKNGIVGRTSQDGEPTPESPVEIKNLSGDVEYKVSGKNLFDKDTDNFEKGYYLDVNGEKKVSANWGIYDVKVLPNEIYTISGTIQNNGAYFWWLDSNKNLISLISSHRNITTTSPTNAKYISMSIVWNETSSAYDKNTFMLEKGSTATEYEPYIEQRTFPLSLSNIELCEIDNYKDKIYSQDGKFYLHKEIEKISGTVNWVVNSIASNNRAVIPLARIGYPLAISGYSVEQCLSNYFQKTSQQEQSSSTEINTISANNDNIYIKFDSSINTTSLAKTKLDSMTDLIIYYPSVTPTTTEITEENYPTLYGQLKDIQDYLVQYKINNEFLLDYSSPEIEY